MTNIQTIHETYVTNQAERYHPLMSLPVRMSDGSHESADQLAYRAHNSAYGQHMRDEQPLRFTQRYDYADRSTMLNELGTDLCPIGHQKELGWHMAQVIEKQRLFDPQFELSDDDAAILMFTCQIHDMGEMTHDDVLTATGAVVGDIPAGNKTPEDRLVEKNVRLFLYETFYSDVAKDVIEHAEAIIAHEDDTLLHELFEAAHEAQTLETTLRARAVSDELGWYDGHDAIPLIDNSNGRARAALGMGRHVMHDHLPKFESYGHFYHMADLLSEVDPEGRLAA
jgi:hypothetical protein